MKSDKSVYVVAHNIRSLHNVGSVFRTADAAGVAKIYLTGYTPKPIDELGRVRSEIAKTALGAECSVQWEVFRNPAALITRLKKQGIQIIALENALGACDYRTFKPKFPVALIIGNEVRGVSPALLKRSDAVISLPMRGTKESLNVSVAFGIAMYKLLEKPF